MRFKLYGRVFIFLNTYVVAVVFDYLTLCSHHGFWSVNTSVVAMVPNLLMVM